MGVVISIVIGTNASCICNVLITEELLTYSGTSRISLSSSVFGLVGAGASAIEGVEILCTDPSGIFENNTLVDSVVVRVACSTRFFSTCMPLTRRMPSPADCNIIGYIFVVSGVDVPKGMDVENTGMQVYREYTYRVCWQSDWC